MQKGVLFVGKKIAAIALVATFLFIHGFQLLHTHDHTTSSHPFEKTQVVKIKSCSVCDYHFAKDSDYSEAVIILQKVQVGLVCFNFYQSQIVKSIGLSYSDRGPPALA